MFNSNSSNRQITTEPTDYVKAEPYDDSSNLSGCFSFPNDSNSEIILDSRECKAGDELPNNSRNNFKKKNKKAHKRKADTEDNTSKQKKTNDMKPPKFEPDYSKDSDSDESAGDDLYDSKFKPEPYDYRNTAIIGHICEVASKTPFFKLKRKNIQGVKCVIPDLVNDDLPPCNIKLVPEIESYSCNLKNYEWEKFIHNESVNRIDNNIKRTVDFRILPEEECERIRNEVMADLNYVFSEEKSINLWHCFGSYLQGIVYRNALGIDICYKEPPHFENVLQVRLYKKLKTSSCFLKPFKVKGHRIGIVHKKTKILVIIWFSSDVCIERSLLMKLFLDMNPNLKYLTVYLNLILTKYRIKKKRVGVLPPYSTFWLVVFFMQQKNLLPAVIDVRKAAQITRYVSGWNCSLPEDYSYPIEPVSVYSLLLGFFDFYKDFDFLNYVICPYLGHVITLSDIENLDLCTDEWSVYLRQIRNPDQVTFTRSFLNLQDPTDLSCNLGFINVSFDCIYLNMFKAVCHRLSSLLPKHVAKFDKMNCVCQIFPDFIDEVNYYPRDFVKYEKFVILRSNVRDICQKKLNQCYCLEAVRKLMESVFRLERKNVAVSQSFMVVKFNRERECVTRRTFPVMHLEYCSSENTWHSDYMKEIIPEKGPVRIYLRCEIDLINQRRVDIYAQGEARFIYFLRGNFKNMLASVLNQIISP